MSEEAQGPSGVADAVKSMSDTVAIVKAVLVGGDLGGSQQLNPEEQRAVYGQMGALDPPYDPEMLCMLFEHSNSLRQNVDSYATNIHAFGHRFEPCFPLDGEDASEQLGIELDEIRGRKNMEPLTDQERAEAIEQFRNELKHRMLREQMRLKNFFDFVCMDDSFVSLRKITCQDLEVQGNAYWEVLRDREGMPSQFVYVPSFTMRLMPLDVNVVDIEERVRTSITGFKTRHVKKRFRRFIQRVDEQYVWFKELGDPRCVSAQSGTAYESFDKMKEAEEKATLATEVLHFKIHSMRSPYGVPRWIGNLLSVLGSRQSEEVNFLYFDNKSIPPMAMLVSGGRVSEDSVRRIESFIESNIKGRRNWHKILILEAEPAVGTVSNETSARMKIELRPLLGAIHQDALFQKYDAQSRDKVGESFRIPRLLRGDMRDFNRSTAFAALTFAEQQVFQPERQEFDFKMNRKIMPALDARYHEFVSLAPITRDPEAMSGMVKDLVTANVLTPEEGREISGDIFNRMFKRVSSMWSKQPPAFTLAGFDFTEDGQGSGHVPTDVPGASEPARRHDKGMGGPLGEFARMLVGLRGAMRKAQGDQDMDTFKRRHAEVNAVDDEPEIVKVPQEIMESWLRGDAVK